MGKKFLSYACVYQDSPEHGSNVMINQNID